jgi:hypothetical protein
MVGLESEVFELRFFWIKKVMKTTTRVKRRTIGREKRAVAISAVREGRWRNGGVRKLLRMRNVSFFKPLSRTDADV